MKEEMDGDTSGPGLRQRNIPRLKGRRSERGTAMLEFAASIVLFLSILYGILGFGQALFAYHSLAEASREATRYAVVRGANSSAPVTSDQVKTYVKGILPGLNTNNITVTTTWTPNNSPGGVVSVRLNYTFNFNFPLVPKTAINMTSTSKMTISQ